MSGSPDDDRRLDLPAQPTPEPPCAVVRSAPVAELLAEISDRLRRAATVEDLCAELLCTLTLPRNRELLIDGDERATAELYRYIEPIRQRFNEITHRRVGGG